MDDPKALWKTIQSHANKAIGEDFWNDIAGLIPKPGPRIDIYETDGEVVVVVELPGLSTLQAIRLNCNGQFLHLRGEIHHEYPVDDDALFLSERFYGKFQRKVRLPCDVFTEDAVTGYRNGLLVVRFRRKPREEDKPIPLPDNPN